MLTLGPQEKHNTFLKRVEKKLTCLALHQIYPAQAKQVVVLLEGLKSDHLIEPVVQLRTCPNSTYNEWIKEGDLKHLLEQAQHHMRVHKRMAEKMKPKNSYKSVAIGDDTDNGQGTRNQRQSQRKQNTRTQHQPGGFVKRADKFKAVIEESSDKVKTIIK